LNKSHTPALARSASEGNLKDPSLAGASGSCRQRKIGADPAIRTGARGRRAASAVYIGRN
jgi:hypothetical protein